MVWQMRSSHRTVDLGMNGVRRCRGGATRYARGHCGVGLTSVGRRGASFGFCLSLAGVVYYVIFTETPLVFSLRLIILLRITLVTGGGSSCVQSLPRHLENPMFLVFSFWGFKNNWSCGLLSVGCARSPKVESSALQGVERRRKPPGAFGKIPEPVLFVHRFRCALHFPTAQLNCIEVVLAVL